jgi:hypothetical protein
MSFKQNKGKIKHGAEVTEIDMELVGAVKLPAGAVDSVEEIAGDIKVGMLLQCKMAVVVLLLNLLQKA